MAASVAGGRSGRAGCVLGRGRGGRGGGGGRARLRENSLSLPGRAKGGAEGTRGLGKVGVGRSELGDENGDLKRAPFSLHFLGPNFGSSRVPMG